MSESAGRKPKAKDPIDAHVGSRLRIRRIALRMSQETLGGRLGLTFQQVQKYEKGTNRIGASRLQQIATIVQVPVAHFFEGLPDPSGDGSRALTNVEPPPDTAVLAMLKIGDKRLLRKFIELIEAVAIRVEAAAAGEQREDAEVL
jgi:transcriptional regulator with XRE-family HTH domain